MLIGIKFLAGQFCHMTPKSGSYYKYMVQICALYMFTFPTRGLFLGLVFSPPDKHPKMYPKFDLN